MDAPHFPTVENKSRLAKARSGKLHSGWTSRGYIPHFDAPGEFQHIVFRLADALPIEVIRRLDTFPKKDRLRTADAYLDQGVGSRALNDPRIASLVMDALRMFDGDRYRLLASCVMPNHVHVLIEQIEGWPLGTVVHAWKSYTANQANRILGRRGRFWAADYFDRSMRDEAQTASTCEYIENNPVVASLCIRPEDWPWSSAGVRA